MSRNEQHWSANGNTQAISEVSLRLMLAPLGDLSAMHKNIWDLAVEYSTGFGQGRSVEVEHGQVSRRTNDPQKKGKAVPGPYPLGPSWSAGPPCLHSYLSSGLSSVWSVAFFIWFPKLLSSRLLSPYLQSNLCISLSSPLSCSPFLCVHPASTNQQVSGVRCRASSLGCALQEQLCPCCTLEVQ